MKKVINWLKNHIGITIIVLLIIPFLCIPVVALILNIGVAVSKLLPNKLIILRINMDEIVTQSEFIYYYSCFLGIEVTGILSYLLYKLTVNKYSDEAKEKVLSEHKKVVEILNEILIELKGNREAYRNERNSSKWSFYSIFEIQKLSQYGYGQICQEFKIEKWEKHLSSFIFIQDYLVDPSLMKLLTEVYKTLDSLSNHTDINQIENTNFIGFNDKINKAIDGLVKNISHFTPTK